MRRVLYTLTLVPRFRPLVSEFLLDFQIKVIVLLLSTFRSQRSKKLRLAT